MARDDISRRIIEIAAGVQKSPCRNTNRSSKVVDKNLLVTLHLQFTQTNLQIYNNKKREETMKSSSNDHALAVWSFG